MTIPRQVNATTCGIPPPLPLIFSDLDGVFAGEVIAISDMDWTYTAPFAWLHEVLPIGLLPRYDQIEFKVKNSWKGITTTSQTVSYIGSVAISNFTEGDTYLVYARRSETGWVLIPCINAHLLTTATTDMQFLATQPQLLLTPAPPKINWRLIGLGVVAGSGAAGTGLWLWGRRKKTL